MAQVVALKISKDDTIGFASVDKKGELITDRTGAITYTPAALYYNSEYLIQLSSTDKVISGNTYCIDMSEYTGYDFLQNSFSFNTIEILIGGIVDFSNIDTSNNDYLDGVDISEELVSGGVLLTIANYSDFTSLADRGYILFDYTGSPTITIY